MTMSSTRRRILSRKQALLAATCTVGALSSQLLACDPLVPPARDPVPAATDDAGAPPAPDVAKDAGPG